ncbi:MAG: DedA family protein [Bacilli bacterium]
MSGWISEILQFLESLGVIGVALGLMIEIIPSEIVLAYAGYLVANGTIGFWSAIVAGVVGGIFAQLFLYWLGKYGGRPIVEKYGKYLFISKHHVDMSEEWFRKYGAGVVFTARFIPVVRHAISIPAGMARMNIVQFIVYTGIAAVPWSIGFVWLGMKLGTEWSTIKEVVAPKMPLIIAFSALFLVGYILFKRWRGRTT